MKIIRGIDAPEFSVERSVLTIGNFDGVHRGHQQLIAQCGLYADDAKLPVVVLTFDPHPLALLRPKSAPEPLMTLDGKLSRLEREGVDLTVIANSTMDLLTLEAEEFVRWIVDKLHPVHIIEGSTFGFGRGRRGNPALLKTLGQRLGFDVSIIEPVNVHIQCESPSGRDNSAVAVAGGEAVPVSSSLIRRLLADGLVHRAALCLGRPYELRGLVVSGDGRGRSMGIPTANVGELSQLVPGDGVYAGSVTLVDPDDSSSNSQRFPAAISIGTNPTFRSNVGQSIPNVTDRKVEAHILDFEDDVAGSAIRLEFDRRLRDQQKFDSPDALVAQIAQDIDQVRVYFAERSSTESTFSGT